MTFTYDGTLDTDLEAVRFEVGDTVSTTALFTDAEINYALAQGGNNVLVTAANLCDQLAVRFSRQADFDMDGQGVKLSQKAAAYRESAAALRLRSSSSVTNTYLTKIDGYQPLTGTIPDSQSRDGNLAGNADYDVGRFDR